MVEPVVFLSSWAGAVVVGGTSGLGQRLVERLSSSSVPTVFSYFEAEADATRLARDNALATAVRVDVRSHEDMLSLLRTARTALSGIELLVYLAGENSDTTLDSLSYESWRRASDVNLYGALLAAKVFGAEMQAAGKGAIVNVGSVASIRPRPRGFSYVTSKGALDAATRSLALEFAPELTVNAVAPGWIETDRRPRGAIADSEMLEAIPLRRFGTADDIATTILFLGAPNGYVTGQVIAVDGGYVL